MASALGRVIGTTKTGIITSEIPIVGVGMGVGIWDSVRILIIEIVGANLMGLVEVVTVVEVTISAGVVEVVVVTEVTILAGVVGVVAVTEVTISAGVAGVVAVAVAGVTISAGVVEVVAMAENRGLSVGFL